MLFPFPTTRPPLRKNLPTVSLAHIAAILSLLAPRNIQTVAITDEWEPANDHGNIIIYNHCPYTLYLHSVGALKLHLDSPPEDGYVHTVPDTPFDELPSGETWTEPMREGCTLAKNAFPDIPPDKMGGLYCEELDKENQSGASIKIHRAPPGAPDHADCTQLEYNLGINPDRGGDNFLRLDFDVSLLDCGKLSEEEEHIFSDRNPGPWNEVKREKCPGYDWGFALLFGNDTEGVCGPIRCTGERVCKDVYTIDRTRLGEPSLACDREFWGDVEFHVCWDGFGEPPDPQSPWPHDIVNYNDPTSTRTPQPTAPPGQPDDDCDTTVVTLTIPITIYVDPDDDMPYATVTGTPRVSDPECDDDEECSMAVGRELEIVVLMKTLVAVVLCWWLGLGVVVWP